MRNLTLSEAAASTNIWFKVESEEEQRMFQEELKNSPEWEELEELEDEY
jgi:hypothetical protein